MKSLKTRFIITDLTRTQATKANSVRASPTRNNNNTVRNSIDENMLDLIES